jgi:hypothetical protein
MSRGAASSPICHARASSEPASGHGEANTDRRRLLAAHDAALGSPRGQRALADLPNFHDTDGMVARFGEEVVSDV